MLGRAEFIAYAEAIRRAAEGLDNGREQRDRLRRRLAVRRQPVTTCAAELRRAYEEATETATGGD
jgi:hypothetical protein